MAEQNTGEEKQLTEAQIDECITLLERLNANTDQIFEISREKELP